MDNLLLQFIYCSIEVHKKYLYVSVDEIFAVNELNPFNQLNSNLQDGFQWKSFLMHDKQFLLIVKRNQSSININRVTTLA